MVAAVVSSWCRGLDEQPWFFVETRGSRGLPQQAVLVKVLHLCFEGWAVAEHLVEPILTIMVRQMAALRRRRPPPRGRRACG